MTFFDGKSRRIRSFHIVNQRISSNISIAFTKSICLIYKLSLRHWDFMHCCKDFVFELFSLSKSFICEPSLFDYCHNFLSDFVFDLLRAIVLQSTNSSIDCTIDLRNSLLTWSYEEQKSCWLIFAVDVWECHLCRFCRRIWRDCRHDVDVNQLTSSRWLMKISRNNIALMLMLQNISREDVLLRSTLDNSNLQIRMLLTSKSSLDLNF